MQTDIQSGTLPSHTQAQADEALRKCVHCGFCNATCPTYQLTGNELDGPRGRIYLIKQALEGHAPTQLTQQHLDRCLTCTACETTCPSGVPYHTLLGIGREYVDTQVPRPGRHGVVRRLVRAVASRTWLFRPAVWLGNRLRAILPKGVRDSVPAPGSPLPRDGARPAPASDAPAVALLSGCVHPVLAPATEQAARRVLERLGQRVIDARGIGCCGALHHHFGDAQGARRLVARNVQHLDRLIREEDVQAVVTTASGCGAFMRDYPALLADPRTGEIPEQAMRVSKALKDIAQVIDPQALAAISPQGPSSRTQLHCPCTLEHGLHLSTRVRELLSAAGIDARADDRAGHCCGSAGAWSLLQPEMATALGDQRAEHLERERPSAILTANVGCQQHLAKHTKVPLRHWVEEVEARTR